MNGGDGDQTPWDAETIGETLALAPGDFARFSDDLRALTNSEPRAATALNADAVLAIRGDARGARARCEAARAARSRVLVFDVGPLAFPTPTRAGRPLSLTLDRGGGALDPSLPSALLAAAADPRAAENAARAEAAIRLLRERRLSIDGGWPEGPAVKRGRALLIDEVKGDPAIVAANGGAADFAAMLAHTRARYSDADIAVLACPDEMRGQGRGHLTAPARAFGLRILDAPLDPWAAIEAFDDIHVVASPRGWEALALDKRVVCHATPLYSGLSLTEDMRPIPGRPKIGRLALIGARLFASTRYLDPWTRRRIAFEEAVERVSAIARRQGEFAAPMRCLGVSGWKRETVRRFLAGSPVPPSFAAPRLWRRPEPSRQDCVWAAKIDPAALPEAPRPLLIEDGFVRSFGLGAARNPPLSLAFDRRGLYCDATRVSDLEAILESAPFPADLVARAAKARARIVAAKLSKYNVGAQTAPLLAANGRRVVLVPGQVENDLSLRLGGGAARDNLALLEAARAARPEAFLIFKPHPDVVQGFRPGRVKASAAQALADAIVDDVAIDALIDVADEIFTMTSLAGFEALMRGKAVATCGMPFYAGWGLTEDSIRCARRMRRLALDELVAGALILYPRYLHPVAGYMCEIEELLDQLDALARATPKRRPASALRRLGWRLRSLVVPHFA
jgi:capsular polysaccharide export protein